MTKKLICLLAAMLLIFAGSITVYASNLDGLDDRGETENLAGITWDEMNEMSSNSPNSLTPLQGLMLWMFIIIAFLKLAQKMDNLLQSLGLNVTQTGGRALGDLFMAGMALKNLGGVMSKGMGMFGNKGGGAPGGSSSAGSSGTGSSGSTGPTPIPSGSPGRSPSPTGSAPTSSTPSGGGAAPGSAPAGGTPSGGTAPSGTSSSGTTTSSAPASSRDPIGRAVRWMSQDGTPQKIIKTAAKVGVIGAKGGVIGLGVAGAKYGAASVGNAIASRLAAYSTPPDPGATPAPTGEISNPIAQSPQNTDRITSHNPEEFQSSKPLGETEHQPSIPTSTNEAEYQDTGSVEYADDSVITSVNAEGYQEASAQSGNVDLKPIPTSVAGDAGQESDTGSGSTVPSAVKPENGTWHESKPIADGTKISSSIPSSVNKEVWSGSGPLSGQTTDSQGLSPAPRPATPVNSATHHSAPVVVTQQSAVGASVSSADTIQSGASENSAVSAVSSESVSVIKESSSVSEVSAEYSESSSGSDAESYESSHKPMVNQTIAAEPPAPTDANAAVTSQNSAMTQPEVMNLAQTGAMSETIHAEPSAVQAHSVAVSASSEQPNVVTPATVVQSQTNQAANVTNTAITPPTHSANQPNVQAAQIGKQSLGSHTASSDKTNTPSRPTAKGKTKSNAVKGRQRKR